jgi:hypothetical protein
VPSKTRRKRPSVTLSCVADLYTTGRRRIVEFSSESGGGLISFWEFNGRLRVEVYRVDETVDVIAPRPKKRGA